jgi:hypothetical protein
MRILVRLQQSRRTGHQGRLILPNIILITGVPEVTSVLVSISRARDEFVTHNVFNPIGIIIQHLWDWWQTSNDSGRVRVVWL